MTSQIVDQGAGQLSLSGKLTSETVTDLEQEGRDLLTAKESRYVVDLANVSFSSSAGVALLLAWMRAAKAADVEIVFRNLPTGMQGLLKVSDLEEILPVEHSNA